MKVTLEASGKENEAEKQLGRFPSKSFVQKHNHINGIENFWNQTKMHLRKFNGIDKRYFNLFLKECEWRFNIWEPDKLLKDLVSILKVYY
jgi:transposase